MLTAAAVLGSDNDADLLRAVSGRGEDEIVEAIDEALARSLLTEIAPPAPTGRRPTASPTRLCAVPPMSRPPWPGAGCCTAGRPTS